MIRDFWEEWNLTWILYKGSKIDGKKISFSQKEELAQRKVERYMILWVIWILSKVSETVYKERWRFAFAGRFRTLHFYTAVTFSIDHESRHPELMAVQIFLNVYQKYILLNKNRLGRKRDMAITLYSITDILVN